MFNTALASLAVAATKVPNQRLVRRRMRHLGSKQTRMATPARRTKAVTQRQRVVLAEVAHYRGGTMVGVISAGSVARKLVKRGLLARTPKLSRTGQPIHGHWDLTLTPLGLRSLQAAASAA